jgi:cell division septation protein DedD
VSPRRFPRKLVAAIAAVGATGLVAAGLVLGAGTSSAVAVKLTQTYTCPFPLIGTLPVEVVITSNMPESIAVGQATGAFDIKATSTVPAAAAAGLGLVGATSIEGTAFSGDEITAPGLTLPLTVPVSLANQPVPPSGPMTLIALGQTPSLTFTQPGEFKIYVKTLRLKMSPKKSDGSITGLGTFESECVLNDGQPTLLHTGAIVDATSTTIGGPTSTSPTTTSTTPTSTSPTTTTTGPTTTTTSPTATTTSPTTTTTQPTTTTTTGGGVAISYNLSGTSVLKNLSGSVPLSGGFSALADLAAGTYTGDLTLNQTSGNFKLFGFIPTTASVAFQQVGKFSGTVKPGTLTTTGKLTIKLPTIAVYGLPVGGGETCQTITPSDINLKNNGAFDPLSGGKLAGTYAMSGVQGCGWLNDWVSPFVMSTGNTIDVTLVKK